MNKTSIAWTDYTSNPIRARNKETGAPGHYCTHVSEGCDFCYAGEWNLNRYGTGLDFTAQNAKRIEMYLNEAELREWFKPKYAGSRVFAVDMADWMHELVPDAWIFTMLDCMRQAKDVTFQLLTKRPERLRPLMKVYYGDGEPLGNLWVGVTAENQRWADVRIPLLLDTPAASRFVSYEPALGALDLRAYVPDPDFNHGSWFTDALGVERWDLGQAPCNPLDWCIVGAESGSKRRSFDLAWAEAVQEQCTKAGVAYFFKQGSAFKPGSLAGVPERMQVREFPLMTTAAQPEFGGHEEEAADE